MIEIELTQDQVTIIDDIDSDLVDLNWYAHWFKHTKSYYADRTIRTGLRQTTQSIHRVILSRILDRELLRSEEVDHINRNTLDNRRENLRLVTDSQNKMNRGKTNNNISGYKGVTWHKRYLKWYAQIGINGKIISLGYFNDPIEAALAYDKAAKYYHGEFANLNFKD